MDGEKPRVISTLTWVRRVQEGQGELKNKATQSRACWPLTRSSHQVPSQAGFVRKDWDAGALGAFWERQQKGGGGRGRAYLRIHHLQFMGHGSSSSIDTSAGIGLPRYWCCCQIQWLLASLQDGRWHIMFVQHPYEEAFISFVHRGGTVDSGYRIRIYAQV
jgi:hypothetical protein